MKKNLSSLLKVFFTTLFASQCNSLVSPTIHVERNACLIFSPHDLISLYRIKGLIFDSGWASITQVSEEMEKMMNEHDLNMSLSCMKKRLMHVVGGLKNHLMRRINSSTNINIEKSYMNSAIHVYKKLGLKI